MSDFHSNAFFTNSEENVNTVDLFSIRKITYDENEDKIHLLCRKITNRIMKQPSAAFRSSRSRREDESL